MAALPSRVAPMLATAGPLPADDAAHAYEVKWDGVRAMVYVDRGSIRMESRNLLDITPRYPELHGLAGALGDRSAILDGEVVAFDEAGRPSFQRLQQRMHVAGDREVRRRMGDVPVALMLFDVLWLDGDVTGETYVRRREILEGLGLQEGPWCTPTHHVGDGAALAQASRAQGLEGIVAKRLDSVYEPGRRTRAWIKVKNQARQEVVVGGWLPGEGGRSGRLGALLVGVYEGGALRYAGRVGTGFTNKMLVEIGRALDELARDDNPFADKVPHREARFVEPCLVAEVEFTEWTSGGTLRHPSFKGFRDDKAPEDVVREPVPWEAPGGAGA